MHKEERLFFYYEGLIAIEQSTQTHILSLPYDLPSLEPHYRIARSPNIVSFTCLHMSIMLLCLSNVLLMYTPLHCPANLPVFSPPFWIRPSTITPVHCEYGCLWHSDSGKAEVCVIKVCAAVLTITSHLLSSFFSDLSAGLHEKETNYLCLCKHIYYIYYSHHRHSMEADTLWLWFLEMVLDQSWLSTFVNYSGENCNTPHPQTHVMVETESL